MISVLHLLGTSADFQTRRTHESLRKDLGAGFAVETRTIGNGGNYRNVALAVRHLRKSTNDLIHAWGLNALVAAAVAGKRNILFSPETFAGPKTVRWVRSIMSYLNVEMVCATATQQRLAVERGVNLSRCHVIRPGVEFGRIRRRLDYSLRASLGLKQDDFVLLSPGESTRPAAHEEAVWACGILNVLDRRYKLLLWGKGAGAKTAMELSHKLHQSDMVKLAEPILGRSVEFEELLPATDACLITAKGPVTTLPIAMCMAAALPIVSTVTYTVAELLEDRHTALMVPQSSPRMLAQRILDLRAEPSLQWSISDMARTEAYEYFSLTRMLNQYRSIYEQFAAGSPVTVAAQPAGAGLRFHGRG
jgi:glycosyltransferase involved in cell wall biosynthesis